MFEIIVTVKAVKDFKKLDTNTGLQIAKKLKEYSVNPFCMRGNFPIHELERSVLELEITG